MQGKRTNITKVLLSKLLKYGLSSFIFACALAIGLIAFNYVVAVKAPSFDVTKNKVNTLSEQTLKLLHDIDFPVSIKAFYTVSAQRTIGLLLEKYMRVNNGLTVEYIDPIKSPTVAEEYDVSLPSTIIFEAGNRRSRINPPLNYMRHEERDITIALYRLLSQEETKMVYFTTGHGELSITSPQQDGLSIIRDRLIEQNYLVESVNLLEKGKVPDDCTLLVVAGPTVPFTDQETEMIKVYIMDNNGSVFMMINPGIQTNLDKSVRFYGIEFGNDYIYETSSRMTTVDMGGAISPFCTAQDSSEITEKLPNQNFIFPLVRSVNSLFANDMLKVTRLLASSRDSWAETDFESWKTVNTNQKPIRGENEKKGPVTVAIVIEAKSDLPDSLITRTYTTVLTRSAFFGDADFVKNYVVSPFPSNINLFLNTVNWVTRNENIIEITPHLSAFTPVELNSSERRMLSWLTLFIFPSSILMVGFIVWYRRR